MFCARLTNSRPIGTLCAAKMSLRGSTDYSFSLFSCMPTPCKALECRGDIKTREDTVWWRTPWYLFGGWEVEWGSGRRFKVSVSGFSCIEIPVTLMEVNTSYGVSSYGYVSKSGWLRWQLNSCSKPVITVLAAYRFAAKQSYIRGKGDMLLSSGHTDRTNRTA